MSQRNVYYKKVILGTKISENRAFLDGYFLLLQQDTKVM